MSQICAETGDICLSAAHWDYELATARRAEPTDPVVTLLRDPVERTLSEFFFIRSKEGRSSPWQDQWDFQNETFVHLVLDEPDDDKALDSYLHAWPEHPGFNRQVLYLAGFKGAGQNAASFRWTGMRQQREFLSLAKQHLADIQAFGFTDCYVTSTAAMARALEWDEAKVTEMATKTHERAQLKPTAVKGLRRHHGGARAAGNNQFGGDWRSLVDQRIVEDIELLNWADVELHRFAQQQFKLRFGKACVAPAGTSDTGNLSPAD